MEAWQQSYRLVRFLAQYSFHNRWVGLNEAWAINDVGRFHVTAAIQILVLEHLGACSGQYGSKSA